MRKPGVILTCLGMVGLLVTAALRASNHAYSADWVLAAAVILLILGSLDLRSYFRIEPERRKQAIKDNRRVEKAHLLARHLGDTDTVLVVCFGPERVPMPQEYYPLATKVMLELNKRGIRAMAATDHSEVALAIKNDPADRPQSGSPAEVLLKSVKWFQVKYLLWLEKSWLVHQRGDGWRMYGFQQKGEVLTHRIPPTATPREVADQVLDALSTVERITAARRQDVVVPPWEETHPREGSELVAEAPATSD